MKYILILTNLSKIWRRLLSGLRRLRRVCGSFTRPSIFSGIWKAQNMPGLSLPSRIYSSSTLMDGEALVSEQQFDDWGEDELLQELAKLKAHFEQK